MPKVTVIINCYNGERYLRQAIDSVYAQSYEDWELVLWDNASIDQTSEIAHSYDSKLKYFRGASTVPLGAARKLALEQATGEWIAFLDCDDYWFPNKLERQIAEVNGTAHVLCYAGMNEVNPDGSLIRKVLPSYPTGWMLEQQLFQFEINMVTPIMRRDALQKFNLNFDDNITASEEYNLFVRLAAKGTICTMQEVLGCWRISKGSLTDRQISKWGDERFYTLKQLQDENPGIESRYPDAFKEARARGEYYRARYLMSVGDRAAAGVVMKRISDVNPRYKILWIGMRVPFFWSVMHENFLKRRIIPKLLRIFDQK